LTCCRGVVTFLCSLAASSVRVTQCVRRARSERGEDQCEFVCDAARCHTHVSAHSLHASNLVTRAHIVPPPILTHPPQQLFLRTIMKISRRSAVISPPRPNEHCMPARKGELTASTCHSGITVMHTHTHTVTSTGTHVRNHTTTPRAVTEVRHRSLHLPFLFFHSFVLSFFCLHCVTCSKVINQSIPHTITTGPGVTTRCQRGLARSVVVVVVVVHAAMQPASCVPQPHGSQSRIHRQTDADGEAPLGVQ
jgi:hypothetical protein